MTDEPLQSDRDIEGQELGEKSSSLCILRVCSAALCDRVVEMIATTVQFFS